MKYSLLKCLSIIKKSLIFDGCIWPPGRGLPAYNSTCLPAQYLGLLVVLLLGQLFVALLLLINRTKVESGVDWWGGVGLVSLVRLVSLFC